MRRISFQRSLLLVFVPLILLSAGGIFSLNVIRESRTKSELSQRLIKQSAERLAERFQHLLSEAETGVQVLSTIGLFDTLPEFVGEIAGTRAGMVPSARGLAAVEELNFRLIPYLKSHGNVGSAEFASERGLGFLLYQMGTDRYRCRIVNLDVWGKKVLWLELDHLGRTIEYSWQDSDYDPRTRSWFAALAEAPSSEIRWTEPVAMYATGDLGMTAASWWLRDGVRWVGAMDVLLRDITEFTQNPNNALTANSLLGVFTLDWNVVGLPRLPRYSNEELRKEALLNHVSGIGAVQVVKSLQTVEPLPLGEVRAVELEIEGKSWWAGVVKYPVVGTRGFLIAITAPDDDLLLGWTDTRNILMLASILVLFVTIAFSIWLARSFSRPLSALTKAGQRISRLDFGHIETPSTLISEIHELVEVQRHSLRALDSFSRYVPMEVVRELVNMDEIAKIGGKTHQLSILFTDIAAFTTIAEQLGPQETTLHLSKYFPGLIGIIEPGKGTVNQLLGDGIFAFWGAPSKIEFRERLAVEAALAIAALVNASEQEWRRRGLPALKTRIGLAAGEAIVGNVGAPSRLIYTALGDSVNLASRLEGINKEYGTSILADSSIRDRAGDDYVWRRIDKVRVLGRQAPVVVYELIGRHSEVTSDRHDFISAYERAWDFYASGKFDVARDAFLDFERLWPNDGAAARMITVCKHFCEHPAGSEWVALSEMTTK